MYTHTNLYECQQCMTQVNINMQVCMKLRVQDPCSTLTLMPNFTQHKSVLSLKPFQKNKKKQEQKQKQKNVLFKRFSLLGSPI